MDKSEKSLRLLMLPGLYTGDMWHLAAATVLAQHTKRTFIPITVISISDLREGKCGDDYIRGSQTFKYFRSIGVPILLAKIDKDNSSSSRALLATLSGTYIDHILAVYRGNPKATFEDTWGSTRSADHILDIPNTDGRNVFTKDASAPKYKNPIVDISRNKLSQSGLNLKLSTSIVIQCLKELRLYGVGILRKGLSGFTAGDGVIDPVVAGQIDEFVKHLKDTIPNDGKRVILFNYRKGNVNPQHDSSVDLLRSFKDIVDTYTIEGFNIVVVDIGGLKETEPDKNIIKDGLNFPIASLYKGSTAYDKRYTAGAWNAIATDEVLSRRVFGVFGGRSGSIDIAAFMGVNTCSWDEPLFNPPTTEFYPTDYLYQQTNQYLRLYNQCSIQAMTLLDAKDLVWLKGGDLPKYIRFDKQLTLNWLSGNPVARPPLAPHNMSPVILRDAMEKLESDLIDVKAINIP